MAWVLSEAIRIVVPGPPKALERNRHRIVNKKTGEQFVTNYLPTKSRAESSAIRRFAFFAMGKRPPFTGPIDLRFAAYLPIAASWSKKKRAQALADEIRPTGSPDFDNILKLLSDSFKELVWRDDKQVTDCKGGKRYSDRPRLVIEVRELTWEA